MKWIRKSGTWHVRSQGPWWTATHDDYDPTPDGGEERHWFTYGKTLDDLHAAIEEVEGGSVRLQERIEDAGVMI